MSNNTWKYNTNFICTYKMEYDFDDDDRNILYQIQLLDALELKVQDIVNINIDEALLDERINELYERVKFNSIVNDSIKMNPYYNAYKDNPLIIFKMLFSYDAFDQFHKKLCSIFNNQNLDLGSDQESDQESDLKSDLKLDQESEQKSDQEADIKLYQLSDSDLEHISDKELDSI